MNPRVWAEVDLAAVRHNVTAIRTHVGLRVDVMPVVKANAYGHGMLEVARVAIESGAEWLGVATAAEGVALRKVLPGAPICLFSPFGHDEAEEIVTQRLTPLVSDLESARVLSLAAHAVRGGVKAHLEVDTGMGRSGVLPEQAGKLADYIARMPAILINGMATHFASAENDPDFTEHQIGLFQAAQKAVEASDTRLDHLHAANSAAMLQYPDSRFNLVRPGLLMYGIRPEVAADTPLPDVRPVMSLKTRVALVRTLQPGHSVSYGRTHVLSAPTRVATLPVGYGDGYPRSLSGKGEVLIGGRRAPIIGLICMDMLMVDVTSIPEAVAGAEVVLIGEQGGDRIRVEEIARWIGTTPHDVTTRLSPRVARVYLNGPK